MSQARISAATIAHDRLFASKFICNVQAARWFSTFGRSIRFVFGPLITSVALLLALTGYIHAQVSTADIVGTASDVSNAVVSGVKVTATNLGTGLPYTAVSNASGDFTIPQLPAGHYKIVAEMVGFKSWSIPDVDLAVGDRFRADARLEVGNAQQTVEVTGEAPAMQTDSATVATEVSQVQIEDLPTAGRNFIALANYVAGATNYSGGSFANGGNDDRRRSGTVSANGRSGAENNFNIDGVDNNERFVNTLVVKPSEEGVAEMNVMVNSFSAELSRTSGAAVVVITKGGTNQYHGSAFEYLRNQLTDARQPNLAVGQAKPNYRQNNFGGSIGGPTPSLRGKNPNRKNQTFFFFDYEVFKNDQGAPLLATVPTSAMRTGNFAGQNQIFDLLSTSTNPATGVSTRNPFQNNQIPMSEINPISLRLINMYPLPTSAAANNNFGRNGDTTQTDKNLDTRIDHRFSENNNFFVRYSYGRIFTQLPHIFPATADGFNPLGLPSIGGTGPAGYDNLSTHGLAIVDTVALSPTKVLVLRAGYSRYNNLGQEQGFGTTPAIQLGMVGVNVDPLSSGFPDLGMTSFTGMGEGGYYPTININNVFTESGSFQWAKGSHIFKFGGEFTRRQDEDYQSMEPRVSYQFTPAFTGNPNSLSNTGNAMASFLLGYPATSVRNRYLILPGYRFVENNYYAQDDYRVNHWLTLNIGLRWDYFSPVSEAHDRISNFNFATDVLMIAGQNGVSNTVGVRKDRKDFGPRFGFAAAVNTKTVVRGGYGMMYTPLMLGTPGAFRNPPFNSAFTIANTNITQTNSISDPLPPLIATSAVNLNGPITSVSVNYKLPYVHEFNFTAERQLPFGMTLTSSFVGALGRRQSGSNQFEDLNGAAPGAANVQTRRILSAIYPNLANVNTVENYYTTHYLAWESTLSRRFAHGMSLNINHTWVHTEDNSQFYYIAPATPATRKANSNSDIRNRVATTFTYEVPFGKGLTAWYDAPLHNWKINAIGFFQTGLPFSITQTGTQTNSATGTNGGTTNFPNATGINPFTNVPAGFYFNPAAFVAQPNVTWGNLTANPVHGPGTWNMDLSVHREFKVKEKVTLQFRAEAFDFTNSEHPANPIAVLGQAGFGTIITHTGSRTMQFALKLLF
jgi:hypothetical protein